MKKTLLFVGIAIVLGLAAWRVYHGGPKALLMRATSGMYKDGTYTGTVDSAYYGDVQVSVTITNGKIASVQFLQYPNDNPTSSAINHTAIPYLQQEAIEAQSGKVNAVTGATLTSQAFTQSLSDALQKA